MSKLFLTSSLLFLLVSSAFAFDNFSYPYAGIILGSALTSVTKISDSNNTLTTNFKPGYMAGLTAGLSFKTDIGGNIEKIRAEAEIGFRSNKLESVKNSLSPGQSVNLSGSVSVTDFMVNGYFENSSLLSDELPINLFLTVGAGAATATIIANSGSDTQFAYQGGLGAGYEITNNLTMDLTYRYLGTTTFRFAGTKADYGSHNILLGARYSFK